ncbi:class I SAM-dependent methyltransferase [Tateyamaria sp. ANG-S1]|uniref:class I SAM-dependent methyltransferase n=1 Tax=Tateyamaria sp. ANG-S1 TaxID=1577905 RepID=UPI00057FA829|nr:class I SAM-dependent methyltransferase [Tateyamaria sp. ANG-S1]KIC48196.1 hypothetical protein RA29_16705 [Tateyamaria sp. ANG-S1]
MDELYDVPRLVRIYDALNSDRSDFDFYTARLPPPPARILDISCGTGLFTLDLAHAGYDVTGIDPAPEMIAFARSKPEAHRVDWHIGRVSDLGAGRRFDAIVMTGHAFQYLLTDEDVAELFEAVAARLTRDGRFWFETRNPCARAWERWAPERAQPPIDLPGGGCVQVIQELTHVEGEIVTFSERYTFSHGQASDQSRSQLRFMPADRIEALAHNAGLAVDEMLGNWDGSPVSRTSPEIIMSLKPHTA